MSKLADCGEYVCEYLELELKLFAWRAEHPEDTMEEDAILDEMDRVWWKMTPAERELVNRIGLDGQQK